MDTSPASYLRTNTRNLCPAPEVWAVQRHEGRDIALRLSHRDPGPQPTGHPWRTARACFREEEQNAIKAAVTADWRGHTSWTDTLRPGRVRTMPQTPVTRASPYCSSTSPTSRSSDGYLEPAASPGAPEDARKAGTIPDMESLRRLRSVNSVSHAMILCYAQKRDALVGGWVWGNRHGGDHIDAVIG